MARRKNRKDEIIKGFWALSPLSMAVLVALAFLIIMTAFLVGEVYLFVRNPRGEVTVPDFTGMQFATAESTAAKAKLNPRVGRMEYSDEEEKDTIIGQEPTPGVKVKEGRAIYFTVSKGKRDIEAPNLLGMTFEEADAKTKTVGLVLDKPSERYSDEAPVGIIISQSPPPGALVARAERIKTVISRGMEIRDIEMPDVMGMTLNEAMTMIEQVGLRVSRITRVYSAYGSNEKITGQAPEAGRSVKRGSDIILTLTLPSFKRVLGERQFRVVVNVPASENGIEVTIVKNDFNETKEVYKEVVQGPARVEKLVDAYGSTTISIYFDGNLYREETY